MNHGLNNTYLYAVSKICLVFSNEVTTVSIQGTGFFIIKGKNLYLITNRHLVQPDWKDPQYQGYKLQSISFDRRSYNEITKTVEVDTIEIKYCDVLYADNNIDDIACIKNIKVDDCWSQKIPICIEYSMLADSENFEKDLSICDSIAFIGFPTVYDHKNNMPILRSGVISSDPRLDYSFNGKEDRKSVV